VPPDGRALREEAGDMTAMNDAARLEFRRAGSEAEICASFPAMKQLRPHLDEDGFVAQIRRQMKNHGYTLVNVVQDGKVVAAAGYRIAEFLAWGRTFYVDDLIVVAAARRQGFGGRLLDWLIAEARASGCGQFHLDSGVQRHDAHRLYLGRKLVISSHHFSMVLC
jgi:GNAT superfamily N-acetyltransferase